MRYVSAPLQVDAENGRPVCFRVAGREYRVRQVLNTWVVEGKWWEREVRRRYFLVLTSRGIVELCRSAEAWLLVRMSD